MLVSHDLFLHIAAFVHGAFGAAAAASFYTCRGWRT